MMQDYEVTLKFRVGTDDPQGLDCPTLTKMLAHRLTSYEDGRRSFDVELVIHGLIAILHTAFRDCIDDAMMKEYDREIVDHGNGRRTARWYMESTKKFEAAKKPWISWTPEVTINRLFP
ncbi:MAG: hypothetical protein AMS22_12685 [Thiotrichales bacterium SG8_50]|nr:MAG: hypothetical protein AMS22_12685 [Thiotrichales bacterium SG8_50]